MNTRPGVVGGGLKGRRAILAHSLRVDQLGRTGLDQLARTQPRGQQLAGVALLARTTGGRDTPSFDSVNPSDDWHLYRT
jgi:hypothetical protein